MTIRLVCPFCRAVVADGAAPVPGTCPGCSATYAGDGATPIEAASAALAAWGGDEDPAAFADRLFRTDPADPDVTDAVASDERPEFYRWWVFRR